MELPVTPSPPWSFITCEWRAGHFAGGVIFKMLIVLGGHFQIRGALLGGSFNCYESGIFPDLFVKDSDVGTSILIFRKAETT